MAISEFEIKRIEKVMDVYLQKKRPPVHIRKDLDFMYKMSNQSIELVEVRPQWNDPSQFTELEIAKITFVKNTKQWKIFWMKSDLKWHSHKAASSVASLEDALAVIDADEHGCFFG